MIYFQAYTNTYAPVDVLKKRYGIVKKYNDIVAIAIGTRPDCVDRDILELINSYTDDYEIWIEYGLQTIHDRTLHMINRGHSFDNFLEAITLTRMFPKIKICVHTIIGLPEETREDMIMTAKMLAELNVEGVKIHPLHVVRDTKLAVGHENPASTLIFCTRQPMYDEGEYVPLDKDQYIDYVTTFLEYLSPTTVIQRLTADCPKEYLVAPQWLSEKQSILSTIELQLLTNNTFQGKKHTT